MRMVLSQVYRCLLSYTLLRLWCHSMLFMLLSRKLSYFQCGSSLPITYTSTTYNHVTPKSGAGLHKTLLRTVLGAPQSFFDETDSGITLNRFSKDMTLIDGPLPNSMVMAFSCRCRPFNSSVYFVDKYSRFAVSRSNCPHRDRIDLHGSYMSSRAPSCISTSEVLPPNIETNAVLGFRIQKPLIYPLCRNSGRLVNNSVIWVARAVHHY